MTASSPLVKVDITSLGEGVNVKFTFTTTHTDINLPLPNRRMFDAARMHAGGYLDRMIDEVDGQLRPKAGQPDAALRVAFSGGQQLLKDLAAGNYNRVLRLQGLFRDAWRKRDGGVPLIEVRGHDDSFPVEMLPLIDLGPMGEGENLPELEAIACRMLAFSAVVRRIVPGGNASDWVLRNDPALPLQFLGHQIRGESRFLHPLRHPVLPSPPRFLYSLGPRVFVEGPWPTQDDPADIADILVNALSDPRCHLPAPTRHQPRLQPTYGPPVMQIHHFACHYDTTAAKENDYVITLQTETGDARPVTLAQLRRCYEDRDAKVTSTGVGVPSPAARGIVILNACGPSTTNPVSACSFPKLFLHEGHRAFLGTETKVPDEVAAQFSHFLYIGLLGGLDLGQAILRARHMLLKEFHNPLGALFVMYGEPGLHVKNADRDLLTTQPAPC